MQAARDPEVSIPPTKVGLVYGLACSIHFLLPAAYYLAAKFEKREDHFEAAVLAAINSGGNNMARAALTGKWMHMFAVRNIGEGERGEGDAKGRVYSSHAGVSKISFYDGAWCVGDGVVIEMSHAPVAEGVGCTCMGSWDLAAFTWLHGRCQSLMNSSLLCRCPGGGHGGSFRHPAAFH